MKVLLYSESFEKIKKSGLGRAIIHQKRALTYAGIDFTTDPHQDFDLLHINTYFPKSYWLARTSLAKGKAVVYHAHSTKEDFMNSFKGSNLVASFFKEWLIESYKQSNAIITPTLYSKELLEDYGLDQPIYAVSNGIDLALYRSDSSLRSSFRFNYAYKENDFVVLGIGLYIERKGILDFVDLARRNPDMHFIWFGDLDFKWVPKEIQDAITHPPDNLRFPGYVPNPVIRQALQACDVYLMPTYEETEGMPALEACASRIPLIARDIPVFKGWIQDGIHAHMAQDVDDFDRLLRQAKDNQLEDLTEAAYEVALARDLHQIGQQYKAIYQTLI